MIKYNKCCIEYILNALRQMVLITVLSEFLDLLASLKDR